MKNSERSVVFINQATGYLTIDIINAFADSKEFKNVALIAGSVRVQDVQLRERVEWTKIRLYDRGNPRKKLWSWLTGTLQIFWLLLTKYRKYEIFYITIPPFAYLLSLILPNRFSVLVFDVYPDVLTIFNIRKTSFIYRIWTRFNRILFRKVWRLYTIGDSMALLLKHYTTKDNIIIINNWSGLTRIIEVPREENIFLKQHNLQEKFIVQYSGNIGVTHNVEIMLELAQRLVNEKNIFFQIIGRGDKFHAIEKAANEQQLPNVQVLPFQPDNLLNYTLSGADVGVVLLDEKTDNVSIPSKIYNLQAVGTPILAIAKPDSELASHLHKYKNGVCFQAAYIDNIAIFIKQLAADPMRHADLKQNSKFAGKLFTSQNAQQYLNSYVQDAR